MKSELVAILRRDAEAGEKMCLFDEDGRNATTPINAFEDRKADIFHYTIKIMNGIMAEIVEVDNAGRIVLPKRLREEMGIKGRTRLILTHKGNKVIMMRLDVDEITRKLEEELSGIDVEKVAESVRREINAKIAEEHRELSSR